MGAVQVLRNSQRVRVSTILLKIVTYILRGNNILQNSCVTPNIKSLVLKEYFLLHLMRCGSMKFLDQNPCQHFSTFVRLLKIRCLYLEHKGTSRRYHFKGLAGDILPGAGYLWLFQTYSRHFQGKWHVQIRFSFLRQEI